MRMSSRWLPSSSVADCSEEGFWVMDFERSLSRQEFDRWLDLLDSLNDISLTGNKVSTTKIVHCAKIRTSDPLPELLTFV